MFTAGVQPGSTCVVFGAGLVGLGAVAGCRLQGAERVICIDRFDYRLQAAAQKAGADDVLNYEDVDVRQALNDLTGGRGPDAVIDAVGMEAHHGTEAIYLADRAKQAARIETDRPFVLRQAIQSVRNGGTVSIIGAYGGFADTFPIGAVMNRSLTIRSGQCHVQRYMRPLLERITNGEIDPTFVITHEVPLTEAPKGYEAMKEKLDDVVKIVLKP
jgi:threonine dehydrogenase-like Zn-dependent dehydrogenase